MLFLYQRREPRFHRAAYLPRQLSPPPPMVALEKIHLLSVKYVSGTQASGFISK